MGYISPRNSDALAKIPETTMTLWTFDFYLDSELESKCRLGKVRLLGFVFILFSHCMSRETFWTRF
jgi:hypothetical protein